MAATFPKILPESAPAAEANEPEALTLGNVFDAHAAYVGRSLRCLGVRERELGDALQEVFLVVHRRLGELENPRALRKWLYAICLRKALTFRRRAARRREDAVAEPPEPDAPSELSPHERVERAQDLEVAIDILASLDPEKKEVFILYEVEQLPMSEVAELVGCPLQTAYSRLYAARRDVDRVLRRMRARGEKR